MQFVTGNHRYSNSASLKAIVIDECEQDILYIVYSCLVPVDTSEKVDVNLSFRWNMSAARSFNKLYVNIQNYYVDVASCHRILHYTCATALPLYLWSKPSIYINCAMLYYMLNAQLFLHQWHIPHREHSLPQQWKPGPEVTGCYGNCRCD